jgi:hypothetical protein
MIVLAVAALAGLTAALFLPARLSVATEPAE